MTTTNGVETPDALNAHGERWRQAPGGRRREDHRRRPGTVPTVDLDEGSVWEGCWRLILLAVAAVGDAINFKIALGQLAGQESDWKIWSLVLALTAAAVSQMHFAGVSARRASDSGGRGPGVPASALTLLWFALGACAFWLRLNVTQMQETDPFSDAPVNSGSPVMHNLPMSLLLLSLYLATGAVAAWSAYNHGPSRIAMLSARWRARRPRWGDRRDSRRLRIEERREVRREAQARRRAARRLFVGSVVHTALRPVARGTARRSAARAARRNEKALRRVEAAEGAVEKGRRQLDAVRADIENEPERLAASLAYCEQWAEELKQRSRLALAMALADPAGTSALTSSSSPLHSPPRPADL
jgi:hypothetical protein